MKITLARSAGFCFGVKRAISMALDLAAKEKNIVMLGDIVHNEDVVRQIAQAGIRKISRLGCGTDKRLLIRAHGAAEATYRNARQHGYIVVDATCPMVKEIHAIVRRMEQKGCRLVVIGDHDHDEVRGIAGQLKQKPLILHSTRHIPWKRIGRTHDLCVVAQSTQNREKVEAIVSALQARVPAVRFFNTICRPTRLKQEEIRSLPLRVDVMIVIGSRSSANTRRLYEISKSLNPRSHWIQSKKELRSRFFKGARSVGITSGASTPDWITAEVVSAIRKIG